MPTFTAAFPVIFNSVTVAKSNVSPEVGVVISQVTSCSGSGSGSGSGSSIVDYATQILFSSM